MTSTKRIALSLIAAASLLAPLASQAANIELRLPGISVNLPAPPLPQVVIRNDEYRQIYREQPRYERDWRYEREGYYVRGGNRYYYDYDRRDDRRDFRQNRRDDRRDDRHDRHGRH